MPGRYRTSLRAAARGHAHTLGVALAATAAATALATAVAAPSASADISPTSANFVTTTSAALVVRSPFATVTCTNASFSGQTPSSDTPTSLTMTPGVFSGCTSSLGGATVTASGTWTIGLPTPPSTDATLGVPAGGIVAVVGLCTLTAGASTIGGGATGTWTDGGSAHDQSQPPSSQRVLANAGGLTLGSCIGPMTATVSGAMNVTNVDSATALWANQNKYTVAPNPLRFPDTAARSDSRRAVRVNNPGGEIDITSVRITGDAVFTVDIGDAGVRVPEQGTAPFDIKFSPTAPGDYRAKIELKDDSGNVVWTFEVTGRGTR
jgi:hypothetical protein